MITIMRCLKYEGQLKQFLRLKKCKENCDEMIEKNEDEIKKNRDALCNSEDWKTLLKNSEITLKRRAEIVVEMNEMLKPGGDTSIYRGLHRMEGIIARAHVNWQEQQLNCRDTSPQKDKEVDYELTELDGHNKDDSQEPRNGLRSQPIEELSIHSQGDKTKSNKTSVFSKTSSVSRVLDFELNALKEQRRIANPPRENQTRFRTK